MPLFSSLKPTIEKAMDRAHRRIRRFRALIIKEFYQIVRDPSSIIDSIVHAPFFTFSLWIWRFFKFESFVDWTCSGRHFS